MEQTTEKKPTTKVVEKKEKKSEVQQQPTPSGSKITHKGFPADSVVQQYVQYAYEIWGIDLVTTIECENWTRDSHRQSSVVKNWVREKSFGYCQISQIYHPEIVNDPQFWNDWQWQIRKCNELLRWGTKFYARNRIIKWQKCTSYVMNRFTFN